MIEGKRRATRNTAYWAEWAILVNQEHPMAAKSRPSPGPRRPRRTPVEVTTLLAPRPLSEGHPG
jgi:hypothetical protein